MARSRLETDDPEEREFQRLWGPWAPSTPSDAASLFDGFPRPWWISGGWAIEAFTGVMRPHKDVDVTIFRRDLGALREHFRGRLDLWAAGSGTLRPLDDQRPRSRAGRLRSGCGSMRSRRGSWTCC